MKQYAKFSDLPVKCLFNFNGNIFKKVSSKTAKIIEYKLTFYFSKNDLVIVGKHSTLDVNYFK